MANHKSAKTRINRNNKRAVIYGARRSRVRIDALINAKEKDKALEALKVAESELMVSVRKGVFHLNKVARTVSRLSKKIKAL